MKKNTIAFFCDIVNTYDENTIENLIELKQDKNLIFSFVSTENKEILTENLYDVIKKVMVNYILVHNFLRMEALK